MQIRKVLALVFFSVLAVSALFFAAFLYGKLPFQRSDFVAHVPATLKVSLLNDAHVFSIQKKGEQLRLLKDHQKRLLDFVHDADAYSPSAIVLNGDIINGISTPSNIGMSELSFVGKLFDASLIPKIWNIGNHELRSVSSQQWMEAVGVEAMDRAFEYGDYRIIALDSASGKNVELEIENEQKGFCNAYATERLLSERQYAWLEKELQKMGKIRIVFMHHPPITGDDVEPGYNPEDAVRLRKLFSKYGVAAVFSGHVERLAHQTIDGVDYYTFPGITKSREYDDAFTRIRMIDKKAYPTLFYRNAAGEYVTKRVE